MGTFHPSTTVVAAAREIMHPKGLPAAAPVDEEEDARELYAILIYISAFKYLFIDIQYWRYRYSDEREHDIKIGVLLLHNDELCGGGGGGYSPSGRAFILCT